MASQETIIEMNMIFSRLFKRIAGLNTEHIRQQVRLAYGEYDLVKMRVYLRLLQRDSNVNDINFAIETMCAAGLDTELLTQDHLDARERVRRVMSKNFNEYYEDEEMITRLLFADLRREAAITSILTDRKILNHELVGSLLAEMEAGSLALGSGVL